MSYKVPQLQPEHKIYKYFAKASAEFVSYTGHGPRDNIKTLLSNAFDKADPHTEDDFLSFYRNNELVAEELAAWYQQPYRWRRPLLAEAIARAEGWKTFAEFGSGLGADAAAMKSLGLKMIWTGDVSKPCIEIATRVAGSCVDLTKISLESLPAADFLYSSDVMEHLANPDKQLGKWLERFKGAIVMAPFGVRGGDEPQHQHTEYSESSFQNLMKSRGFKRLPYEDSLDLAYVYGR